MVRNEARRTALLDAAIDVLAEEGARGLTYRAIDAKAEVPAGTASNYFANRDELMAEVSTRVTERLMPSDESIAESLALPRDKSLSVKFMHDIIERFEAGANCGDGELRARGTRVAQQINRLASASARTIVSTVHDLGLSPYARSRNEMARLTCLTDDFNARLRVDILQDGRFIGLVLADEMIRLAAKSPASYGLANITDGACAAAPPDCTSGTLVTGATTGTHMWADDRHVGPVVQNYIAAFAETRARNNPF